MESARDNCDSDFHWRILRYIAAQKFWDMQDTLTRPTGTLSPRRLVITHKSYCWTPGNVRVSQLARSRRRASAAANTSAVGALRRRLAGDNRRYRDHYPHRAARVDQADQTRLLKS